MTTAPIRAEDRYLQNIAQDMVINSYLAGARKTFFSRKERHGAARAELVLPRGLPLVPPRFHRGDRRHRSVVGGAVPVAEEAAAASISSVFRTGGNARPG